jgi:N-acetylneuraminic acid mutarotase
MAFKLALLLIVLSTFKPGAASQELVWKERAELPRPVAGYMATTNRGRLLIIGGSYWKNEKKVWVDLVQSFDPRTNTWRNETSLPAPRSDAALAVLKGGIYVFGGGSGTGISTTALVLRNGKWKTLPEARLPEPRRYAAAVSFGEFIYLLGGMYKDADYTTVTNTFWRWSPGLKSWEVLPPFPGPPRINHAMVQNDKSIYIFGGATTAPHNGVENLNDVYKYDPKNRSWTRLPDLPVANRALSAVSVGHRVLLLGGYTTNLARDTGLYDPLHDSFHPVTPLLHRIADIKFLRIGNQLVGTGGEVGDHIRGKWTMPTDLPSAWLAPK